MCPPELDPLDSVVPPPLETSTGVLKASPSSLSQPSSTLSPTSILRHDGKVLLASTTTTIATMPTLLVSPTAAPSPTSRARPPSKNGSHCLVNHSDNMHSRPDEAMSVIGGATTTPKRSVTWLSTEHWTLLGPSSQNHRHRQLCERSILLLRQIRAANAGSSSALPVSLSVLNKDGDVHQSSNRALLSHLSTAIPPFAILYVRWDPNQTNDDENFVQTVVTLLHQVVTNQQQQSLQQRHPPFCQRSNIRYVALSSASDPKSSSLDHGGEGRPEYNSGGGNSTPTATTSSTTVPDIGVYIVVEFLPQSQLNKPQSQSPSHDSAARLVKAVVMAIPPDLRRVCHGVACCGTTTTTTSPSSSAERNLSPSGAWRPCLEVCGKALLRFECGIDGSEPGLLDERRCNDAEGNGASHSSDSFMGLVVSDAKFLSDLDELDDVDPDPSWSNPSVEAWTVTADWHGNGGLTDFADRARAVWRESQGLPPEPVTSPARRRPPPRRRRVPLQPSLPPVRPSSAALRHRADSSSWKQTASSGYAEPSRDRRRQRMWDDVLAFLLLGGYLCFHWAAECQSLAWLVLAPSGHAELVQHLREWSF